jgi:branched-chain amino acid transport system ATP-binding protein
VAERAELLEVRGLYAGYGDLNVLDDVTLRAGAGRLTLLLGRNGAGKTTLLRALAGLTPSRRGSVLFRGADITGRPVHARVAQGLALVQEGKRLFYQRTVEENLMVGGVSLRRSRRELRVACEEIYARFPMLGDKRQDRCGTLSGGQQQMVAIGQAVLRKPSLLMLDEPSAGLAPMISGRVLETLAGLRSEGVGILLVEQAVELALSYADHVCVLDLGRIVMDEAADRISDLTVIRDIYLSRPPASSTAAAGRKKQ